MTEITMPSDMELVRMAQQTTDSRAQKEALKQIVTRHKDLVFKVVRKILSPLAAYGIDVVCESEDASQVVLKKLVVSLPGFDVDGRTEQFEAWLTTIAIREARDVYKYHLAKKRHPGKIDHPGPGMTADGECDGIEQLPSAGKSPSGIVRGEVIRTLVRERIGLLPEIYREALTLVVLEDRTLREAADLAGVQVSTMFGRVKRALKALREFFPGSFSDYVSVR